MENDMMPEKYRRVTKADGPRELVTSSGWESIQLYADAFLLDEDEVQAMQALTDRLEEERRNGQR